MVEKALPVTKTLYLRYSFCFLFDNVISHFVYKKNTLQIKNMNKKPGKKQFILCNKWYNHKNIWITHFMTFFNEKGEVT